MPPPEPSRGQCPGATDWRSRIDLALLRRLASEILRGLSDIPLGEALHETCQRLSAGPGIVAGHTVEDPLQGARSPSAGSEPGGHGGVGRVRRGQRNGARTRRQPGEP